MTFLPARDFNLEVAKANISGHRIFDAWGYRTAAGGIQGTDLTRLNELSSTPASPNDDTTIAYPADAGEQMTVISSATKDTSAGVGARTIVIDYLDASGDEQNTTVTMNGTTAVDLTPTDVRWVQSMRVATTGSENRNDGDIRIYEKAVEANVYNMILADEMASTLPIRMVPNNKRVIIRRWTCAGTHDNAASANAPVGYPARIGLHIDMTFASPGVRVAQVFIPHTEMMVGGGGVVTESELGITVPEFCIIKPRVYSLAGEAIDVSCHWFGILVND